MPFSWKNSLKALVVFNIRSIDHYHQNSRDGSDEQVCEFVQRNIQDMSGVYKYGVLFLLVLASFFLSLFPRKVQALVGVFPFSVLNKLVCGNAYMKLFEIVPIETKK